MRKLFIVFITVIVFASLLAATVIAQDRIIDTPVNDDLFLSGNTIVISAPVTGDLFAAAGSVRINAEITGDVFVSAGIRGMQVEISPFELKSLISAKFSDLV